ncbi:tRNA (adenosine(37)-N6)-threonylcarbamoyltransferase complex ATPase subunit type 1 TsaE [Nautilia sp. PV-1]|uniref:tRNA (adenosine(37)-N6)-threonylcarbamoyltransferase complex ATPase subunit type 1 TsaE n=1 Tax=Nautilia sp. PV-1 TaxID=2579250 RepID=UPI000FDC03F6|nr:tRNA (adenosine(37)-N6)-threonylcarbamoyltransferase complex ATPase subunit type 1 TsaE [Nautilia sp. PV-1]AZV46474.1 tRNA (adenosine(37)-N6)-threonylcarbamoyltransferase complex ATPase subunit type 1 TsaE [Nautilia sp. PV-1]
MRIEVNSLEDLNKVTECIKKSGKNIVILSGTLGSGKTTLVKEFVKNEGLNDTVTSPTFAIQNIYADTVYHYDLYNKGSGEFLALGMLEELEKDGWHFLEWGEGLEEVLKTYGLDYLKIKITIDGNKRVYECLN